jgi:hypothetical protein
MCAAIGSEARHPVPSDAALHAATDSSEAPCAKRHAAAMRAAIDSKRGITSQAILLPCAQPLILERGMIQCQAMLHSSEALCAK